MTLISTATKTKMHIASGIVLLVFLTMHFTNHALGLSSVSMMETGRAFFNQVWRSWPGTILLYGAILVHFISALDAFYRRKTLWMPIGEVLKIGFGLALPFLIASHVMGTRLEFALSGYDRGYPQVLAVVWATPGNRLWYAIAVIVAWTHGCLGLWFWLRARSWFPRIAPLFHMAAVIVPLVAFLGVYAGGRFITSLPPFLDYRPKTDPATIPSILAAFYLVLGSLIGIILLMKIIPSRDRIEITYFGSKRVPISPGLSVLEVSRAAGIPHVSICGGRGRCSTCRIQILEGLEGQPAPQERERATLASIGAPDDVRLACQLRPNHNLTVLPLVEADGLVFTAQNAPDKAAGRERMVAALFCDLRGFTELSEQKLPYDVVFLLNRYFAMVDDVVEGTGGVVDKFIGDGAIALFGLDTPLNKACRQALLCAARLSAELEALNRSFNAELDTPLRIAIGLHAGSAIVGRMGHGRAASLTAIGDTINIASRLEGLAKEHDAELAVSAEVVRQANVTFIDHTSQELSIRGRTATVETWIVPNAGEIERCVTTPAAGMNLNSEALGKAS
ncbi:adenylate/guanylate cyclase domain-containing protein [Rhizobium sp. KVB221]|uniref:Adenylate/guanylate cyclase domain-containing protein n=1 Tax=Rhizobium setariae TaxID=2801340 RepID=A0A936YKI2_9HYPH|nr:adenylate/guanylate cyclase domain-containing protein [Rhizobium setariae]MBL0371938.1 adenylate/guanylate cyclase domain-containing protein [Rhizobium setariae]